MIDSFAAALAGAFILAENTLYTKEAYQTYFEKLTPDGVITTSRWLAGTHEINRLVLMIYTALKEKGIEEPQNHIVILKGKSIANVIVSKKAVNNEDLIKIRTIANEKGFIILYPQFNQTEDNVYNALLLGDTQSVVSSLLDQGIDISSPTDDRPFFFNVLRPFYFYAGKIHFQNDNAIRILQYAMLIVAIITLVLFFLPFLLNARLRLLPMQALSQSSLYFAMIGAGFMAMEVYMMQRFILYVGYPSYSASAVLSSLLAGLAAGAWMSTKANISSFRRFAFVMPYLLLIVTLIMDYLFKATLQYPLGAKIFIVFCLLFPCGFVGGFFFPLGVERYGDHGKPWFWAINGSFGVLASVFALPVAMSWGYSKIIFSAAVAYSIAALLMYVDKKTAGNESN